MKKGVSQGRVGDKWHYIKKLEEEGSDNILKP